MFWHIVIFAEKIALQNGMRGVEFMLSLPVLQVHQTAQECKNGWPHTRSVYEKHASEAETKKKSNCSLCAVGHDTNKEKIWSFGEMEADHVSAWSKGSVTSVKNCEILGKTHNRTKGNR